LRCFDEKTDEISHKARKVSKKVLQNFKFLRIFMDFYSKVAPFFRIFHDFYERAGFYLRAFAQSAGGG
jgi:hypothetical protein